MTEVAPWRLLNLALSEPKTCGKWANCGGCQLKAQFINADDREAKYAFTANTTHIMGWFEVEAMFAGVPPVVLKHGGPARLIVNDHSGIVAQNADEYVQAIEFLYRDPAARARMAANAARQAREQFGARLCAERLNAAYRRLSLRPKRKRARSAGMAEVPHFDRGARQLVRSLDGIGDEHFQTSLSAGPAGDIATAEEAIAELPPIFANVVMQYRLRYPDDAFLRLWCGLLFAHADRPALAASEFKASMKLRPDIERVTQYFAAAARKSGAHDHASGSLKAGVSA